MVWGKKHTLRLLWRTYLPLKTFWRSYFHTFGSVHLWASFCLKNNWGDKHSAYLDVYGFELHNEAKPGRTKRRIWTGSSGRNSRMPWLTHTWALNGSSLNKWWAWDNNSNVSSTIQEWDLFLCLWASSARKCRISHKYVQGRQENQVTFFYV